MGWPAANFLCGLVWLGYRLSSPTHILAKLLAGAAVIECHSKNDKRGPRHAILRYDIHSELLEIFATSAPSPRPHQSARPILSEHRHNELSGRARLLVPFLRSSLVLGRFTFLVFVATF